MIRSFQLLVFVNNYNINYTLDAVISTIRFQAQSQIVQISQFNTDFAI